MWKHSVSTEGHELETQRAVNVRCCTRFAERPFAPFFGHRYGAEGDTRGGRDLAAALVAARIRPGRAAPGRFRPGTERNRRRHQEGLSTDGDPGLAGHGLRRGQACPRRPQHLQQRLRKPGRQSRHRSRARPRRARLLRSTAAHALATHADASLHSRTTEGARSDGSPRIIDSGLDGLEREIGSSGQADLIARFALPVPTLTICELLGVPYDERDQFQRLSAARFEVGGGAGSSLGAVSESLDYLEDLVARRRREPDPGLLGGLVAEHGSEFTDRELAGVADGLLTGGIETTASMLALGTLAAPG